MKKVLIIILLLTVLVTLSSCQCDYCGGSKKCNICDGDGMRMCYMANRYIINGGPYHDPKTCSVCDNGQMLCDTCDGSGVCHYCS